MSRITPIVRLKTALGMGKESSARNSAHKDLIQGGMSFAGGGRIRNANGKASISHNKEQCSGLLLNEMVI